MNRKSGLINHKATVIKVVGERVLVRLSVESATDCSGCAISSICKSSKAPLSVVAGVVRGIDVSSLVPGQPVVVRTAPDTQGRAAALLLAAPLVVMLLFALAASAVGFSEVVCAVGALVAAFAVYFIIAVVNRRKAPVWIITGI